MVRTISALSPTDITERVDNGLASLTEQDVAAQTSATSFKRGHGYAQYARHGKPEKALEIARGRFKATPNKSSYDAVKTAALRLDQTAHPWPPYARSCSLHCGRGTSGTR